MNLQRSLRTFQGGGLVCRLEAQTHAGVLAVREAVTVQALRPRVEEDVQEHRTPVLESWT